MLFRSNRLLAAPGDESYLIYSFDKAGGPINNNCPATYFNNGNIVHPDKYKNPSSFKLGKVNVKAASPWAYLDQEIRDHLHFIHHQTRASAHNEAANVLSSGNKIVSPSGFGSEMLPSAIGQMSSLNVISDFPIAMGGDWNITSGGTPVSKQSPRVIADKFSPLSEQEVRLQEFRDNAIDEIYKDVCKNGNIHQKAFCDQYLINWDQARKLADNLKELLSQIEFDDSNKPNLAMAAALIAANATRVIAIEIPFGGDNHNDDKLSEEEEGLVTGTDELSFLWNKMKAFGVHDRTTVALQAVFGRTLGPKGNNSGRDHHGKSAVTVLLGAKIKPGVSGGIKLTGGQSGGNATGIKSSNGASTDSGDIKAVDTLASACKTVARACGISASAINKTIRSGKIIESVI